MSAYLYSTYFRYSTFPINFFPTIRKYCSWFPNYFLNTDFSYFQLVVVSDHENIRPMNKITLLMKFRINKTFDRDSNVTISLIKVKIRNYV